MEELIHIKQNFYALNQDGTVKWELTLEEPLYSLPTITSDGLILVGYDTKLIAIVSESMGACKYFVAKIQKYTR